MGCLFYLDNVEISVDYMWMIVYTMDIASHYEYGGIHYVIRQHA